MIEPRRLYPTAGAAVRRTGLRLTICYAVLVACACSPAGESPHRDDPARPVLPSSAGPDFASRVGPTPPRLRWPELPQPLRIEAERSAWTVGPALEFLAIAPGRESLAEIARAPVGGEFRPPPGKRPSYAPVFGYVATDYWVRFALHNPSDRPRDLILELDSLYERVDFARFDFADAADDADADAANRRTAGRRDSSPTPAVRLQGGRLAPRPRTELYVAHRNPVFAFAVPAKSISVIVLRTEKASVRRFPVHLFTPAAFVESERRYQFAAGVFYGSLAAALLFCGFVFAYTRRTLYLYYSFWLLSLSLVHLAMDRTADDYLWPDWIEWQHPARMLFTGLMIVSGGLFTLSVLSIERGRALGRAWFVLFGVCAIYIAALPFVSVLQGTFVVQFLVAAFIALSLFSAAVRAREGYAVAWIYGAAWIGFLLAMAFVIYALHRPVYAPPNALLLHGLKIGTFVELVLYSVAIGYRVRALDAAESAARAALAGERERIARDLHDSLGHELSDIYLRLQSLQSRQFFQDSPPGQQRLRDNAAERVRYLFERLRDRVFLLREGEAPSEALLQEFQQVLRRLQDLPIRLSPDPIDGLLRNSRAAWRVLADTERQLHTVRIFQEWISNALRHSRPKAIEIQWRLGRRAVTLHVIDDGQGFAWRPPPAVFPDESDDFEKSVPSAPSGNSASGGNGLPGLAARAAEAQAGIRAWRRPGRGTHFLLRLPLRPS
ncbi:MAG: histidine kinase [bacterium]|nr:histidine kinase [bacterium]